MTSAKFCRQLKPSILVPKISSDWAVRLQNESKTPEALQRRKTLTLNAFG